MSGWIAFGPWATVLLAVFFAWGNLAGKLATLSTQLSERKTEVDRRFDAVETRLAGFHTAVELELIAKQAQADMDRLWAAVEQLRSEKK